MKRLMLDRYHPSYKRPVAITYYVWEDGKRVKQAPGGQGEQKKRMLVGVGYWETTKLRWMKWLPFYLA